MNFGSWFRGLRGKLLMLVMIPIVLLGIISFASLRGIKTQRESLDLIARKRLQITEYTGDLRADINALGRIIWLALEREDDFSVRKKVLEDARKRVQSFEETVEKFHKLPLVEKGRALLSTVDDNWKQLKGPTEQTISLLEKNTRAADAEMKKLMILNFAPRLAAIAAALKESETLTNEVNEKIVKTSEENSDQVNTIVLSTSIVGSIALLIVGFFISARLAKELAEITQNIGDSSQQVGSASQQLSSSSQQLSSGATEGAASLEETVSSLEELSSMVKMNADNSKEAAALSQSSQRSADQGEAEIQKLIQAMSEIAHSSKKIEEIINVIDDIAFQTNLLALNAAVEAARAGEQGKGFAVVAEAVRNLAQRSASAAKDITTLIKDSVAKTENGAKIADESGSVLKNIVFSVKKVSDLNQEIASASEQQSNGLNQISKAMNQLDQVTQSNAASAEEAAASSEEMSSQAVALQDMVQRLEQIVYGGSRMNLQSTSHRAQVLPLRKANSGSDAESKHHRAVV